MKEAVMLGKDGQPHRYQLRTITDPKTGETETKQIDLGLAEPRAGVTPRESKSTTTREVPRKPINQGTDVFRALTKAMDDIVAELSSKPGWKTPGVYIQIPGQMPVTREQLIQGVLQNRYGVEASVRREGEKYVLDRAWEPAREQESTTVRSSGPAGSVGMPQAQEAPPETEEEQE